MWQGPINLESDDELPDLKTAFSNTTWEAVDTAIKRNEEVDMRRIVAEAPIDELAATATPQLLGAPADVQWPWATGEGPAIQPTPNTGADDFRQQMHQLEQRVHQVEPPERTPI